MRKSLAVALAVVSFGVGAWLSPRLSAQPVRGFPIILQPGQRVSLAEPAGEICEIEQVADSWVKCTGTVWRNLATGYGFRIHAPGK